MSNREKRKLDNKYYLYCFSPGDKEREYFKKYIQETLNDKINCYNINPNISQISPNIINEKNKDELISKIIDSIKRRYDGINEQGKGKIIVIITDCDKAKLEYMDDFRFRFKSVFGNESIFIFNYQSFEDWVFFYYGDNKKTKDEIGRDISEHWDSIFKRKT